MKDSGDGKGTALFVAGGALGVGLAALLKAQPAGAAPDTEKLDYIASLLLQMGITQEAILTAIKNINIPGGGIIAFPDSFLTPWKGDKDPVQIYQQAIRSVGLFPTDIMVDMRNVKRLVIRAESSLNQAVALQVVGNFADSFNLAINVGPPAACPINGQVGFGLAWGDWQPYIGVLITAAIAPIQGLLTIWAVVQE
jgi:hypothetical protein